MIKLIADSTCDLSNEILELYNISIVPLYITIEGKTYKDRVEIVPNDFYAIFDEIEGDVTTANPSPKDFYDEILLAVKDGYDEIIIINMSSGTSGSYQSAVIGKDLFFDEHPDIEVRIRVIDSVSMSHGTGWLLLKSAFLIKDGLKYEEIIDFVEMYKYNVKHFLAVDNLEHLIKSGRLTNSSAFIGKLLKIKPIMTMKNKKGAIIAKVRGRKRVLEHYVRELKLRIDTDATNFIIIGYTSDRMVAENLMNRIIKENAFDGKMYIMQMGVSVGVHVGLGGLSLFFVEKDHMKDNLVKNELKLLKEKKDKMTILIKKHQSKKNNTF